MTIEELRLPCTECVNSRDAGTVAPRIATLSWHTGFYDERLVCRRCYMRLYMAARSENERS